MNDKIQINATIRNDIGKRPNTRLRNKGQIPAIIYGAGQSPQNLFLEHKQIVKAIANEGFANQIISLIINDATEQVVLKELQRHPVKPQIVHMDFMRIKETEKITMLIPLHFIGESLAPGLKQGGIISHIISNIEIRCLPKNLPKFIEADLTNMELNQTIHLSDLKLPEGVEIPNLTVWSKGSAYDLSVATMHVPKAEVEVVAKPAEVSAEAGAEAATEGVAPTTEGSTAKSGESKAPKAPSKK